MISVATWVPRGVHRKPSEKLYVRSNQTTTVPSTTGRRRFCKSHFHISPSPKRGVYRKFIFVFTTAFYQTVFANYLLYILTGQTVLIPRRYIRRSLCLIFYHRTYTPRITLLHCRQPLFTANTSRKTIIITRKPAFTTLFAAPCIYSL